MKRDFQDISQIKNLKGKKVLLRASLNAPVGSNGELFDKFRLKKALISIKYLQEHKAKTIIIGHIGRGTDVSLEPVFKYFQKYINLKYIDDIVGEEANSAVNEMKSGDIILLKNLRSEEGETKNDLTFAEKLSSLADIYVNDCFPVSHREHASVISVPKFLPSYSGLVFKEEFERLKIAEKPEHPALFILGGVKFSTKQILVEKFLDIYDHIFITGALANDFFKAKGYNVGRSVVSDPPINVNYLLSNKKIILPEDVVVLTKNGEKVTKDLDDVSDTDMIADTGPKTIEKLKPIILNAKFILWNGPTGYYEGGFVHATKNLAEIISKSDANSIVGGGDTMSLIIKFGFGEAFSFCSTAGGAMLEFLLNGTLPAIEVLSKNN